MPMMTLISLAIIAVCLWYWVKNPSEPVNGLRTLPQRLASLLAIFRR